jgi:hypothetical protein
MERYQKMGCRYGNRRSGVDLNNSKRNAMLEGRRPTRLSHIPKHKSQRYTVDGKHLRCSARVAKSTSRRKYLSST